MAFLSTTTGPLANPQTAPAGQDWWSQQGLNYPQDFPLNGAQVSNPDATGGSQIQGQPGQPQMQGLPGQSGVPTQGQPGTTSPAPMPNVPVGGNLSDPATWMALVNNPTGLRAWVQQGLGPNASPQLIDYYVSKVQGQPGANPTEQAGSAQYWMQKLQSDPTLGGTGGQAGAPGGATGSMGTLSGLADGSLLEPWTKQFQAPDPQQIANDPNYQFQLQQGLRGVQSGAAARGTLLTGGTQKALDQYGQGLASSFGNTLYNRNLGEYQMNQNTFYQNQDRPFTKLSTLATLGKPQTVPVPA